MVPGRCGPRRQFKGEHQAVDGMPVAPPSSGSGVSRSALRTSSGTRVLASMPTWSSRSSRRPPEGWDCSLPAAEAGADPSSSYVSVGVALVRSQDFRFFNGADAGYAVPCGNRLIFPRGDLDGGQQFHLAVGCWLPDRLRAQLEFSLGRDLAWQGSKKCRDSGERLSIALLTGARFRANAGSPEEVCFHVI